MKTETLNEYLFADLLFKHSQIQYNYRRRKMIDDGAEQKLIDAMTLTLEDERLAMDTLNQYRAASLRLLQE